MEKQRPYDFTNDTPENEGPTTVIQLSDEVRSLVKGIKDGVQGDITSVQSALNEKATEIADRIDQLENKVKTLSVRDAADDDPKFGYRDHLHFLTDVMAAELEKDPEVINRLKDIASQIMRDAVGSDEHATYNNEHGGFLIPKTMFGDILMSDPFAIQSDTGARTRNIPMETQSIELNARTDKDHSTSVTGGFRVYRRAEANQVSASRGEFEKVELKANALMGIAYATDELLRSSPISFAALIQGGFEDEYRSRLNEERLTGTGAGQYMGLMNSPALITVAKEGSQTADTIVGENLIKIRSRCWNYSQSFWMANHDTYPTLTSAHISGTNGDVFLFAPGNGVDVPDTILGRPVIFDENFKTVGDLGDIALINWNEYLEGIWGGASFEDSVHVRFLENETAFRFNVYTAGAPWWRSALTPKNGSTLSPFLTLAERA